MSRISSLDGLRGWFLITMTLSHLVLRQQHWVSKVHFRHVMFVESAQGFIFISGLLFGMVQFRRLEAKGLPFVWRSSVRRAMILWATTVSLTFALMICRDVLPFGVEAFRNWLGTAGVHDPTRAAAILTLAFQPTFLDILPQYILYLLAAPAFLVLIRKGWWPVAAAMTAIWWMVSQLGLMLPVSRAVNRFFATSDGQGLRMAFDPMGWQLLFMAGTIFGALWVRGDITPDRLFPKDRAWAVAAAAILLFFAPLRIATANGWLDGDTISSFVMMEKRADFGPVYLLNFIAAAWLIGWLLFRGGEMRSPTLNMVARLFQKLVAIRPIVCLGRHSLLTYVWHVLLIYTLHYFDRAVIPLEGAPSNYAIALLFVLLFIPALVSEQMKSRPLPAPAPA
ncbi:OpgC domain-containing protein [Falsirhodobacter sp. 1013]|uniref:OpgC domain-containing protein n=1 Tax=Falsirhodobacter sp. 1013 TaxID=3417566 RepID=UPI003EBCFAB2